MLDAPDSILKVKSSIDGAVTFKLLRTRNLPLMVTFLHQEFKKNDKITISYDYPVQKPGDFLKEIAYTKKLKRPNSSYTIASRYRSVKRRSLSNRMKKEVPGLTGSTNKQPVITCHSRETCGLKH